MPTIQFDKSTTPPPPPTGGSPGKWVVFFLLLLASGFCYAMYYFNELPLEICKRIGSLNFRRTSAPTLGAGDARPMRFSFVHPGGLHTQADLDRMKAKVAAHEHPWIDGWNCLLRDPLSDSNYHAGATANLGDKDGGAGRQRASRDAHAAYLNFLRWYIGGDRANAECAIRICNEWTAAVNQDPSGTDIPGLSGIAISEFAMVGELLRICPDWDPEDQERFKAMMRQYFYPQVHGYLAIKNLTSDSHAWANWDICNVSALIAMGVLLDDHSMFNEGVGYFKHGRGTGSIMNAVYSIHPNGLGQWQESGRDQGHAQLGVGMLAQACEIAWNQGVDLFGYADNRLLVGAEYVGATTFWQDLPFKFYTNISNANNYWLASNGRGSIKQPIWELLYNHYVVRRGLAAPNVSALANLTRPDGGGGDHFGYGTLTFTLDPAASPFPPLPSPAVPVGLKAQSGLGRITLSWRPAAKKDANGYIIRRARATDGDFQTIAQSDHNITPQFIDEKAEPGVTYKYLVAARNQAGISGDSTPVTATAAAPGPLPTGWTAQLIGPATDPQSDPAKPIEAIYSEQGNRTLIIHGEGNDIGGNADQTAFVGCPVSGNVVLVARLIESKDTKVGLMMRESLEPGARSAAVTLGEIGNRQTRGRFRLEPNQGPKVVNGNDYTWKPVWYKLQRTGNLFTAFHSDDGVNWFKVGSETITMPANYLVGLAATNSDSSGKPAPAVFDNVMLQ